MSLKLVILGVLDYQNVHPYDVKRFLKHYDWNYLFQINDAKIYYAFDSLLKNDYISVAKVVENEKTPTKTVYAITEKGRAQIEKELYKLFKKDILSYKTLYPALLFSDYADKYKLLFYLNERKNAVSRELELSHERAADKTANPENAATALIIKNAIQHLKADVDLLDNWIARIETGTFNGNIREEMAEFFG
ncbi:PadR family transcriptional regulator [Listeria sp. ILCC797]|uniref:PadR family transcriptional regulator n=1 Tax=Listeria sp. ILCC797 TaxID=1918333 RepID=UPI00135637DE|nr:PadR family transcriptional regulator [Listeria sp. ILCC797]